METIVAGYPGGVTILSDQGDPVGGCFGCTANCTNFCSPVYCTANGCSPICGTFCSPICSPIL